jgi:hypothetical protein
MALPPDVRAARNFRITKGLDDLIRADHAIDSAVTIVLSGEWIVLDASNNVTKTSGETLAAPAHNVACSWTLFARDNTSTGQADAVATDQLTTITGPYRADTKFFETTGTFTAGFLLVVRESTTVAGQGVLDAVDSAAASNAQLGAAIGRVVAFSGGVLTYRTNGAA